MPGPRDWTSGRVPAERLVRYFPPRPPAPPQHIYVTARLGSDPVEGLASLLVGVIGLLYFSIAAIVRGVVWLIRKIRRRT